MKILKRFLSNKMLYLGLGLIAFVCAVFYVVLMRQAKVTTTNNLLRQQLIIARAETNNLTSFFSVFGDSLSILAQSSSVETRNASTIQDMDAFVDQWRESGVLGGIILVDRNGVVQFNSNVLGTRDTGAMLADREYFVWAKSQSKEGEYFIAKPVTSKLGASKGQTIVPIASPIFQNGAFAGVLAASIELTPLTDRYLGLMRVSGKSDVALIDSQGNLLYVNTPELTGMSAFEYMRQHPSANDEKLLTALKNSIEKDEEISLVAPYFDPKEKKIEDHLIVFSPITIGNQKWVLALGDPIQGVTDATRPIYIRQLSVLVLIILCAITFRIAMVVHGRNQKRL